jgi:hypothetical protein
VAFSKILSFGMLTMHRSGLYYVLKRTCVIVLAESRAVREWGLGHIGDGDRISRFTRLSGPG